MTIPNPETVFFALTGGILPSLLWLWFWLQEDRLHPEPRSLIIRTFIFGMIAVLLVLPIEELIKENYAGTVFIMIFLWAAAEEILKWLAAFFAAFDTKAYDEPIDAVIYMLTAALGFAAMENVLFLVTSMTNTGIVEGLITGNLRFIGATLLHVLSSGTVAFFIGISYGKNWFSKITHLLIGIALAVIIHTIFNLYIMNSAGNEIFIVFCFVWVAILLLIAGFEKIKKIKRFPTL